MSKVLNKSYVRKNPIVESHIRAIIRFIYEEGASSSSRIASNIGIGRDPTREILTNMESEGTLFRFAYKYGKQGRPSQYWQLADGVDVE